MTRQICDYKKNLLESYIGLGRSMDAQTDFVIKNRHNINFKSKLLITSENILSRMLNSWNVQSNIIFLMNYGTTTFVFNEQSA